MERVWGRDGEDEEGGKKGEAEAGLSLESLQQPAESRSQKTVTRTGTVTVKKKKKNSLLNCNWPKRV